jgi:ABC-type phosphate transport system ATPase subunit
MKQRLSIAQALRKDGGFLIFDKLTAGVDLEGTREFKALIARLNMEKGKTILIATHMLPGICKDSNEGDPFIPKPSEALQSFIEIVNKVELFLSSLQ